MQCVNLESLLLQLFKNVNLYPHLFDLYIPLHFEQFDVVHDDSSNASSNSNYGAIYMSYC